MNPKHLFVVFGIAAALGIAANLSRSTESLTAAATQPGKVKANSEILVFAGSQEDMDNVAFTIKPIVGGFLVYRGRPARAAKPVLSLRDDGRSRKERIYRGGSLAGKDMLYTIVADPTSPMGYLVGNGAGTNILKASYVLDRNAKHICAGHSCSDDSIAFTWSGAPTLDRMWLYEGRQASGTDDVRFTIRGPIGEAMALLPVLAGMN